MLIWTLADLGLTAAEVGATGTTVKLQSYKEPPARPQSQVASGAPADLARKMVSYLHDMKLL